jgi:hypothetical protein
LDLDLPEGFVMGQGALCSLKASGTIYPVTLHYIPGDMNLEMHFCGSLETQKRKTFCPCQELNAGSSNLQHRQYTDRAIPAHGVVACKTKLEVFLKTSDLYRILEGEDNCLLGCHAVSFGAGVTATCSTGV